MPPILLADFAYAPAISSVHFFRVFWLNLNDHKRLKNAPQTHLKRSQIDSFPRSDTKSGANSRLFYDEIDRSKGLSALHLPSSSQNIFENLVK
jgi:hypothetical protein